jgi:hypothetical protein
MPAVSKALKSDGASPAPGWRSFAFPLLAGVEIIAVLLLSPPRLHALDETTKMISQILKLTTKDDYVMDAKGETIFRRRPFYFVLEGVTLHRLDLGLIKDDIPECLLATRAPVATILRTPPRARQFIEQNYLPVANRIRVLGKMLGSEDNGAGKNREFEIVIPADYALVAEHGSLQATLDGKSVSSAQFLSAGHHQVLVQSGEGRIAVVLASALEKGDSPFSPDAKDIAKGPPY